VNEKFSWRGVWLAIGGDDEGEGEGEADVLGGEKKSSSAMKERT